MTQRKHAFLLLAGLAAAACTTVGCELLVSFDRSLIDAGVEVDGAVPDSSQPADSSTDTTVIADASDSAAPDATDASDSGGDAGDSGDSGHHDAGDAGCTSSSHCPLGEACDTATGTCSTTCSSTQQCNGVCCNGTTCEPGDASTTCGLAGGMCANCTLGDAGGVCINGSCGCNTEANCLAGEACNAALHECTSSCSVTQPCNSTCCSGSTCATTESATACGLSGASCSNCVALDAGAVCEGLADASAGGACGCTSTTDCPENFACDTTTHTCTTSCSTSQACHGGCCSATSGGTCQTGTAPGECGTSGVCATCSASGTGAACLSGGVCGCASTSDCACGASGSDSGACSCTGAPAACSDTVITSFSAGSTTINVGGSTTLTWTTSGATGCTLDNGTGPVSVLCGTSQQVSPSSNTTYTLSATGGGGATVATVTVSLATTATCGALSAASEPLVTGFDSMAVLPTFTGGTLLDGTYVMTSDIVYGAADTNPTGTTQQTVWVLTNSGSGTSNVAADQLIAGSPDEPSSGTLAPIPTTTTLNIALTCGNVGTGVLGYSISTTSPITLQVQSSPGGNEVWTFQKAP